jgi:flagellar protein FlaG
MSEVTKIDARLYPGASVLAPSSSAGVKESDGKVLPLQVPSVAAQLEVVNKTVDSKPEISADMGERVQAAVAQMNEYIQSTQRDLHFSYDQGSGETVVKVLDRLTQEVIRQIPDEIFLKLAQRIDSEGTLSLLSAQA